MRKTSVFDGHPLQYPVAQSSVSKCKKRICVFPLNVSHVPAPRNVDTTFEAPLQTSVIVIDLHNSILAGMLRDDVGGCRLLLAAAGMLRDDAGGCCWRRQG